MAKGCTMNDDNIHQIQALCWELDRRLAWLRDDPHAPRDTRLAAGDMVEDGRVLLDVLYRLEQGDGEATGPDPA
jgi:hypothetical protein